MNRIYRFTCIMCPLSCYIEAKFEGNELKIWGCRCPRGKEWVKSEIFEPKRTVMSVVKVKNGKYPVVSVKTDAPVPKERIEELMRHIASLEVEAPVRIGDVVEKNVLNMEVNLVATRTVEEK